MPERTLSRRRGRDTTRATSAPPRPAQSAATDRACEGQRQYYSRRLICVDKPARRARSGGSGRPDSVKCGGCQAQFVGIVRRLRSLSLAVTTHQSICAMEGDARSRRPVRGLWHIRRPAAGRDVRHMLRPAAAPKLQQQAPSLRSALAAARAAAVARPAG